MVLDMLIEKLGPGVLGLVVGLAGLAIYAVVHMALGAIHDERACHERGLRYYQGMCLRPDGLLEKP